MTYREQMVTLLQRTGIRKLEIREQIADLIVNNGIKPSDSIVLHASEDAEWNDEMAAISTEI